MCFQYSFFFSNKSGSVNAGHHSRPLKQTWVYRSKHRHYSFASLQKMWCDNGVLIDPVQYLAMCTARRLSYFKICTGYAICVYRVCSM